MTLESLPLPIRVETALDLLPGFKLDKAEQDEDSKIMRSRQQVLRGIFRPMCLYLLGRDYNQEKDPVFKTPESVLQAIIGRKELAVGPELTYEITSDYLEKDEETGSIDWLDRAKQFSLEGYENPIVKLRSVVIEKLTNDLKAELTKLELRAEI